MDMDDVALTSNAKTGRDYEGKGKTRMFILTVVVLLAGALVGTVLLVLVKYPPISPGGDKWFKDGAVATTNSYATDAGVQVLKDGGNAVDAAATIQFMLNVVQPQSTGIGGGTLSLIRTARGDVYALDGREEAPNAFTPNAFCNDTYRKPIPPADGPCLDGPFGFYPDRVTGGHPVGVPGVLAATIAALDRFGTYTLAQALAPAIKRAKEGFVMYEHLHNQITLNIPRLKLFPASAKLWLNDAQTAPKAAIGELFYNPELAATFELIAAKGKAAFYDGELSQDIIDAVQNAVNPVTNLTGLMTREDLKGYQAVWRMPVEARYRGHTVYGVPPPGSGLVLEQALMLLDTAPALKEVMTVAHIGRLINVQNVAFADRNKWVADADFFDVPPGYLDEQYVTQRASTLITPNKATDVPVAAGSPPGAPLNIAPMELELKSGTTHFSIMDSNKMVVSWTTTIEENLGSAVTVPGRGFLLNNELTDFSATARDPTTGELYANRPEGGKKPRRTAIFGEESKSLGGKRPRSSMSPTIIVNEDGQPFLACGSPGGSKIPGNVINVIVHYIDGQVSLNEATDLPRVISRNELSSLVGEEIWQDDKLRTGLENEGFALRASDTDPKTGHLRPLGYVESVAYDGTSFTCAADSKRMGRARCDGVEPR